MKIKSIFGENGNMEVSTPTPVNEKDTEETTDTGFRLGIRHLQCFLLFLGLSVAYALRVNLSVAVVAMTDANATNPNFDEFDWNEKTKSLLLSSFFWGYIITQVPAGAIARKLGGKRLLAGGLLLCSVLNILTPILARVGDWQLVCALRVIEGLSQGVVFPSTHALLSKWSPVDERGTMCTYAYSGSQFGTTVMLASSGVLASSVMGWPSIFYIPGAVGIVWFVIWLIWGANSPDECKLVSPEEKKLIETSQSQNATNEESTEKLHPPWLKFFTSPPFLVLILAHCTHNWGFWTLLTEIPSYMKNVLGMDIKSNALLSALPYLAMFLMCFVFSGIASALNSRQCIPVTISRKLFNTIGHWVPMVTLLFLAYAEQTNVAIALLTVTVGINASTYLGFQVNHIDLSPNFAGILMGITNCAANIMSILAPLIVGFIVTDEKDPNQWRIIFFIASGFYLVGNLMFIIFGQSKVQPWNDPRTMVAKKRNSTHVESQH